MNPLHELEAARDRLLELRSRASSGPWRYRDDTLTQDGDFLAANVCVGNFNVAACGPGEQLADPDPEVREMASAANAELIVTLHNTLDSQLSVIQNAIEKWPADRSIDFDALPLHVLMEYLPSEDVLGLARAINGPVS